MYWIVDHDYEVVGTAGTYADAVQKAVDYAHEANDGTLSGVRSVVSRADGGTEWAEDVPLTRHLQVIATTDKPND